jgi:hypothetical protein
MDAMSSNEVLELQRDLYNIHVAEKLQDQDSNSVRRYIRENITSKIMDSDKPWGRYVVGFVLVFMILLWLSTNGGENYETCSPGYDHDENGKCKPVWWWHSYEDWVKFEEDKNTWDDEEFVRYAEKLKKERRAEWDRAFREEQEPEEQERKEQKREEQARRDREQARRDQEAKEKIRLCMQDPVFARCVRSKCDRRTVRQLARKYHPDKGGPAECMVLLNQ